MRANWYSTRVRTNITLSQKRLEIQARTYVRTVRTYVHVYVRTNIHYLKNNLKYKHVPWYVRTNQWYVVHVYVQIYLKNNLKYKHSAGATGTQVGVVSIEGITVYYS